MRWFKQSWDAALRLREEGADIRALTAWAAFGTVDWHTLVTQRTGRYEPGMWDVRSPVPRPTALATLARQIASGHRPDHPVLAGSGWWQRGIRHLYDTHGAAHAIPMSGSPVIVTGATGTLGRAFARLCHMRGLPCRLLSRSELDITDPRSVEAAMARWQAMGADQHRRLRARGRSRAPSAAVARQHARPTTLAQACARHGVRFVHVFERPRVRRREAHALCPKAMHRIHECVWRGEGGSRARACCLHMPNAACHSHGRLLRPVGPPQLRDAGPRCLALRSALARDARPGRVADLRARPCHVVRWTCCSMARRGSGNLANQGAASWFDLRSRPHGPPGSMRHWCCLYRQKRSDRKHADVASALSSERALIMPTLEDALMRYMIERAPDVFAGAGREPRRRGRERHGWWLERWPP
jgi:dTDP-4-dehydrorhamnose reductase